jgi:hypothetical protein
MVEADEFADSARIGRVLIVGAGGVAVTDSASLELTALLGALNPSTRTSVDCGIYAPKSPLSHRKRTLEIPRWWAATAAQ